MLCGNRACDRIELAGFERRARQPFEASVDSRDRRKLGAQVQIRRVAPARRVQRVTKPNLGNGGSHGHSPSLKTRWASVALVRPDTTSRRAELNIGS